MLRLPSRRPFLFRRVGAIVLGATITIAGVLGLSNLQGAGGGFWLLVIQVYGVLAAGTGAAFVYGGLVRPRSLRRIAVLVLRSCAAIVLLTSIVATAGGITDDGELAPFFLGIGVGGVALAVLLWAISMVVEQREPRSVADGAR